MQTAVKHKFLPSFFTLGERKTEIELLEGERTTYSIHTCAHPRVQTAPPRGFAASERGFVSTGSVGKLGSCCCTMDSTEATCSATCSATAPPPPPTPTPLLPAPPLPPPPVAAAVPPAPPPPPPPLPCPGCADDSENSSALKSLWSNPAEEAARRRGVIPFSTGDAGISTCSGVRRTRAPPLPDAAAGGVALRSLPGRTGRY